MTLESKGFYIENKIDDIIIPLLNEIGFVKNEKNNFVYEKPEKRVIYNYYFINNDFHELFLNIEFFKSGREFVLMKEKEIFMEINSTLDSLSVIDEKILYFKKRLLEYFPHEIRKIKIKKLMDKYGRENRE